MTFGEVADAEKIPAMTFVRDSDLGRLPQIRPKTGNANQHRARNNRLWYLFGGCIVTGCMIVMIMFNKSRLQSDPRVEQLRSDFAAIGQIVSDSELKELIRQTEKRHGEATQDERGYPLYELRPWEKAEQPWSWNQTSRPFVVRPAKISESHIKTAPSVEHRYVDVEYTNTSDPAIVEAAATEVWHHFAKEINERHPQAEYKMVTVNIYVDDQEMEMPVGRVWNHASAELPDTPETEWFRYNKSRLIFEPTE